MANKQERLVGHGIPKPLDNSGLGGLVKVNDHVPAEHQIQIPLPRIVG
jgi:hypothetical protein